jgi:hypothetical protein
MGRKEDLEIEKLQAEVAELQAKTRAHTSKLSKFRTWLTVVLGVGSLIGGVTTFYFRSETFLIQQKRRYEFEAPQQIIVLAEKLGSENSMVRDNAAILLSAFEEHAVPILVSNLRRTDTPDLSRSLIASLKLIMQKQDIKPDQVLGPLLEETKLVFEEEYRRQNPDTKAITNYILALKEVGAGQKAVKIITALEAIEARLVEPASPIQGLKRNALTGHIDEAIQSVSGNT